jgi:uncharacterized RDD family membrane protein YckC
LDATQIPQLKRRLICLIYEAMLVFGVLFMAILAFKLCLTFVHSQLLDSRLALQFWLFLVLGVYFVFFWRHGGQTLAMKTWRIQLVAPGWAQLPLHKAIARYLLAWMWFLPAMALNNALGLKGWSTIGIFFSGMGLWALTALFDKERQFLHDRLVGTRLINVVKIPTATASKK